VTVATLALAVDIHGEGVELIELNVSPEFDTLSTLLLAFSDKMSLMLNDLERLDPNELVDDDILVTVEALPSWADEGTAALLV